MNVPTGNDHKRVQDPMSAELKTTRNRRGVMAVNVNRCLRADVRLVRFYTMTDVNKNQPDTLATTGLILYIIGIVVSRS